MTEGHRGQKIDLPDFIRRCQVLLRDVINDDIIVSMAEEAAAGLERLRLAHDKDKSGHEEPAAAHDISQMAEISVKQEVCHMMGVAKPECRRVYDVGQLQPLGSEEPAENWVIRWMLHHASANNEKTAAIHG